MSDFHILFNVIWKKVCQIHQYGFFHLLFANFSIQILSFGTNLLVVKLLSASEFGEIKIIQSYMGVFLLIATLGFNAGVLKFSSSLNNELLQIRLLNYSLRKIVIIYPAVFAIIYLFSSFFFFKESLKIAFLWYSSSLPFAAFTMICISYLQSLNKIASIAKFQVFVKVWSIIFIVFLTYIYGFNGFVLGTILGYIIGIFPFVKTIDFRKVFSTKTYMPIGFVKFSFFSLSGNFMTYIGNYIDIFILDGFSLARESIGYYSFAGLFILAAMQINGTVQAIITPYFSKNEFNKEWIVRQLRVNQKRMGILSIVLAVAIYVTAYFIINIFYGVEYRETILYLRVLLLKYVIYSLYSIVGAVNMALGYSNYNFYIVIITTPISWAISYYSFIYYGFDGVAWGQVFSNVLIMMMSYCCFCMILKKRFA